jgi:hypothetical protein
MSRVGARFGLPMTFSRTSAAASFCPRRIEKPEDYVALNDILTLFIIKQE